MRSFSYKIKDPVGLHARPAGKLSMLVKEMDANVMICYNGQKTEASRVFRILSMDITTGADITVEITGNDEARAYEAVKSFFETQV